MKSGEGGRNLCRCKEESEDREISIDYPESLNAIACTLMSGRFDNTERSLTGDKTERGLRTPPFKPGLMLLQAKRVAATRPCKRQGRHSPYEKASRKFSPALLVRTFDLQNCERINVSYFKPPSGALLWQPGNTSTGAFWR